MKTRCFYPHELGSQLHPVGAVGRHHRSHMAQRSHTAQRVAFEAARRQSGDAAAGEAAARDLAHAFGAVHPEAGTLRAIQAVIDQLDNPASFARNKDAYEKHGASEATFKKWKKKLAAFVVQEEVAIGTAAVDDAMGAELLDALVSYPAPPPEHPAPTASP